MFRLSNLLKSVTEGKHARVLDGSMAIWNFTNCCNLSCLHCYTKSDFDAVYTLTADDIMDTLPKLKANGVKFLIFSDGEPLTRKDIYDIVARCKSLGIVTYLSTNGLYVEKSNAEQILDTFDYICIGIDGSEKVHDAFRGLEGSFKESMKAVDLFNSYGKIKVGIRFTITKDTYVDLQFIFELAEKHNIPKIYISHLVYSDRGLENLKLEKLRIHPRKISSKCETRQYINICNDGSSSRAYAICGDMWAEDPSCYLTEEQTKGVL